MTCMIKFKHESSTVESMNSSVSWCFGWGERHFSYCFNVSVPRTICPFWCYIWEVSQSSSTGSSLFLPTTLQEATLFSGQLGSSERVCRFAPFWRALDTDPVGPVKVGSKEEHHVVHLCITEQRIKLVSWAIWHNIILEQCPVILNCSPSLKAGTLLLFICWYNPGHIVL